MSRSQTAPQRSRAAGKEAFRGDGGKMLVSRKCGAIKGVARRLSVVLRKGPLMSPSIKGMIAAEAINDVKRKSALRKIFRTAESPAIKAEQINAAAREIRMAGKDSVKPAVPSFGRMMALTKPPR